MTRRRVVIATIVAAVACVVWAPALIAERYADGPGGAEVGIARLDRGWEFVYHAVRLSRGESAPTPMTLRATSSPRSFLTDTTTEYSQASAPSGFLNAPSTRSAENDGCARLSTFELGSNRK